MCLQVLWVTSARPCSCVESIETSSATRMGIIFCRLNFSARIQLVFSRAICVMGPFRNHPLQRIFILALGRGKCRCKVCNSRASGTSHCNFAALGLCNVCLWLPLVC